MQTHSDLSRIVVTGATGVVGRALCERLRRTLPAGEVVPLGSEHDLSDPAETFDTFRAIGCASHVFHLAVRAPSSYWLQQHAAEAWYTNTLINANVFEAVRQFMPGAKIVSTLSYSIYGQSDRAFCETDALVHNSHADLAAHSNYKLGILAAQDAYMQQFGISAVSVVLPNVYGTFPTRAKSGRVIDDLIARFAQAKGAAEPEVAVWGTGTQVRDFLYIDDAVSGLIAAARYQRSPMVNLGGGAPVTIFDAAREIAQETDYKGTIQFDASKYTGASARVLNIELAALELGWAPEVHFAEGIRKTVRAWKNLQGASAPGT